MKTFAPKLDPTSAIFGTMMDVPLTVRWIFEHAQRNHGDREVVSRLDDGSIFRYTYRRFRQARRPARKRTRGARHPPRRPSRVVRLEYAPASRAVLRRADDRRGAAHDQHPAFPRAGLLGVPARRRQADLRRRVARAGRCAGDGDDAGVRAALRRHGTRRRGACRSALDYEALLARCSPKRSIGRNSTSVTRRSCATPRRRPAIRRASCSRTVRACCTRSRRGSPTPSTFSSATASCRSCRCSTSTRGAFRTWLRWWAQSSSCPERSSIRKA